MTTQVSFKNHCVVSCGILQPELTFLMQTGFLDAHKVLFTPPGLHVLPDELERHVLKAIERARKQCPGQDIIVVYGRRCYADLNDASKTIDSIIQTQGARIQRIQAEYGYYRKIIVLDAIGAAEQYNAREPETILELFDWTGLEVDFRTVGLARLKHLLEACVA